MKIAAGFTFLAALSAFASGAPADSLAPSVTAAPVAVYRGSAGHTGAYADPVTLPMSLLWRHTTAEFRGNSASPVWANGLVYFGSGDTFYALNTASGTTKWRFKSPNPTKSVFDTTPALAGGFLYVTDSSSELFKIDAQTGQSVWVQKFGGALRSAPLVSNGAVYFGCGNNNCYAVSADTGQTLWQYETQGAITAPPTLTGGLVVFASSDDSLYSINANTGRVAWTKEFSSDPSLYPPVFDGTSLYVADDDILSVLDPANGTKRFQVQLPSSLAAPPTVGRDSLYVATADNSLYALNGSGHKRWLVKLPAALTAPPILAGNVLLAPTTHGVLTGYDADSGALKWQYVMQSAGNDRQPEYTYTEVASAPIYAGTTLYVVSDDGTLSAFRSDAIDGIAPQFETLMPESGSAVTEAKATVGAVVADPGSGIDPSTVALQLDGISDFSAAYHPAENTISVEKSSLPDGPHVLSVQLSDWRGNKTARTWNFTVGSTDTGTPTPSGNPPTGLPPGRDPTQPPPPPPLTSF